MVILQIDLSEKEIKLLKKAIISTVSMASILDLNGTEELSAIYDKLDEGNELSE
jgi:hypothetical protein